jgi:hypothetical protein
MGRVTDLTVQPPGGLDPLAAGELGRATGVPGRGKLPASASCFSMIFSKKRCTLSGIML